MEKQTCGHCIYGHWYSGDMTYTNVLQDDGIHTIKRPCEPRTHYCYQFADGQRKIAGDDDFDPGAVPDWCPLRKCRVCGCTWDHACEGGCYWVEYDLCSKCAEKLNQKEDTLMYDKIDTAGTEPETDQKTAQALDMSPYARARRITSEIRANGYVAAEALSEMCKGLKQMRDERLYTELGYDNFRDYAKKEFNIEERQAYNYIQSYERLGGTFLKEHGDFGVTKLLLLAAVPAPDRDAVVEENDIGGMSTREVKELTERLRDTGEQLSLMTEERDEAKEAADRQKLEFERLKAEKETAEASLKALQDQAWSDKEEPDHDLEKDFEDLQSQYYAIKKELDEKKASGPDEAALEQTRREATQAAEKAAAIKIKEAKEKAARDAKADAEAAIAAAREEGQRLGEKRIKESLEAIEKEKAAALERARDLEKKLSVSADQETVLITHLFDEMNGCFNKICGCIQKMSGKDPEGAGKFHDALLKYINTLPGKLQ